MPDDSATLLDIMLSCRRMERFLRDVEKDAFDEDDEKRWAVVSQLLIIGEAVNQLSDDVRNKLSAVPWRGMAAMRNRLIHEYDKNNWALVWKTARTEVPSLMAEVVPFVVTVHGILRCWKWIRRIFWPEGWRFFDNFPAVVSFSGKERLAEPAGRSGGTGQGTSLQTTDR